MSRVLSWFVYTLTLNADKSGAHVSDANDPRNAYFDAANAVGRFLRRTPLISDDLVEFLTPQLKLDAEDAITAYPTNVWVSQYTVSN